MPESLSPSASFLSVAPAVAQSSASPAADLALLGVASSAPMASGAGEFASLLQATTAPAIAAVTTASPAVPNVSQSVVGTMAPQLMKATAPVVAASTQPQATESRPSSTVAEASPATVQVIVPTSDAALTKCEVIETAEGVDSSLSREEQELALSLLAPLLVQATTTPQISTGLRSATSETVSSDDLSVALGSEQPAHSSPSSSNPAQPAPLPARIVRVELALRDGVEVAADLELPGQSPTFVPARVSDAMGTPVNSGSTPVPVQPSTPSHVSDVVPARVMSPVENKSAPLSTSMVSSPSAAPAIPVAPANAQPSAATPSAPVENTAQSSVVNAREANSAARSQATEMPRGFNTEARQKSFLSPDKQKVSAPKAAAGIAVAQSRASMPESVTVDPTIAPPPTAPVVTASFAPRDLAASVEDRAVQTLAHRAVATVSEVIETQAASKAQSAQSVSLRFKFGGEDLTVRIGLRGGEVTTEFQTDSPTLRAAVNHEWRTLATAPESTLRYHDPIFVSNPSSMGGHSSSSSHQHGQSAAQQQQQQQSQPRFADLAQLAGLPARRNSGAAATDASAPAGPALVTSSRRLSAVA